MNRRGAGVILFCVSAFLYSVKYISAAIYFSTNRALIFSDALSQVGNLLNILSAIAFIGGVSYIVMEEIINFKQNK